MDFTTLPKHLAKKFIRGMVKHSLAEHKQAARNSQAKSLVIKSAGSGLSEEQIIRMAQIRFGDDVQVTRKNGQLIFKPKAAHSVSPSPS